ncbi:serine protease [Lentzea sp. BCCO 10_0061]|uniref:Serine protease n=1 Tax=Lentzea sokolovensis TaxID=3095429 RepID=A0ABU4USV2_9PSEU|nr:serine protease [Lentzea sp. BCCO 10_0061]MDX8142099.1 serine protease [Lentzea sp. BCCO 10_0061]
MLAHPLDWTDVRLQELHDVVSATVYRESDIESIVREGGLSPSRVQWNLSPRVLWTGIFNEAALQLVLPAVVQAAKRNRPALAQRVDELLAAAPVVAAPTEEPVPDWQNTGNERQIVAGQNTLLDVAFLEQGLDRSRAVCKLHVERGGLGWYGTGFRIGESTLLSNHHVLFPDGQPATGVIAEFGYELDADGALRPSTEIKCAAETITGERVGDFAVIATAEPLPPNVPILRLRDSVLPKVGDRVSIIQHPLGLPKKIAMHHNLVRHATPEVIQYWTDTERGSSGSPVFDDRWRVVALHHSWDDAPDDDGLAFRNQGTTISRVVARLDALGVRFEG